MIRSNMKYFYIFMLFLIFLFVLIYDNKTSLATDVVSGNLSFSGYEKLGDNVEVINAKAGSVYNFEVKSQITGKVIYTESNVTGILNVKKDFNECIITCSVDDEIISMYSSSLPVMYINSETEYSDVVKEKYSDASIKLVGNSKYSDGSFLYDGFGSVKLRGNSTALRDKKPLRIKLDKSANLLNLGKKDGKVYKSKHWVLLANDIDHTLVRNKLLYDFSRDIGFEYYFNSTNVALIYNGEYVGTYLLCEQRRVDEGRVNITDWISLGEDIASSISTKEWSNYGYASSNDMEDDLNEIMYQDYSWIDNGYVILNGKTFEFDDYGFSLPNVNGGFLIEMDHYSFTTTEEQAKLHTSYGIPVFVNYPDATDEAKDPSKAISNFMNTSLYKYAKNYTQSFEYALHSKNFVFKNGNYYKVNNRGSFSLKNGWKNTLSSISYTDNENNGKHYSELFDIDSLVNNFLFVEYSNNWDSMKTSTFYYKDVDKLAKMGPMWDFDWVWGNINMYNFDTWYPETWHTTNEHFTREYSFQSYNWHRLFIKDPYFLVKVYERYHEIRPVIENMIKSGGLIDQYYEYLKYAGRANDARWSYTYATQYNGAISKNFDDSFASMKEFIKTRVKWLDSQFSSLEKLISSFGYYKSGDDISVSYNGKYIKVKVSNPNCNNVEIQINGVHLFSSIIVNGEAIIEMPNDKLYKDGRLNVVVVYEKNGDKYILNDSLMPSGNYEYIPKSDYITFKYLGVSLNVDKLNSEIKNSISDGSIYTNDSWKEYVSALNNAKSVINNEKSMQEDIDNAYMVLLLAKGRLIKQNPTIEDKPVVPPSDEKPPAIFIPTSSDDEIIEDIVTNVDEVVTSGDDNNINDLILEEDDSLYLYIILLFFMIIIVFLAVLVLRKNER